MKYILPLLIALPMQGIAAETVELKFSYDDSTNYLIKENTLSQMSLTYDGDPSNLPDYLSVELPFNFKAKQENIQSINTGKLSTDNSYPITMSFDRSKTSISIDDSDYRVKDKGPADFEGMIVNGLVGTDGSITFVSMNKNMPDSQLDYDLEGAMKSMFEQLSNPAIVDGRALKIGDSTSYSVPMIIPVADLGAVTLDIERTYTLKSIDEALATFDIDFDVLINTDVESNNFTAVGFGSGTMTYDSTHQISLNTNSSMELNISVPYDTGHLKVRSTITFDSTVSFSAAEE